MPYTITVGERCPISDYYGTRCVLLQGHRRRSHHTRADGGRFIQPGDVATYDTGQSFDQWAQDQGIAPATPADGRCYATGCVRPAAHIAHHANAAGEVWPANLPTDPFASAAPMKRDDDEVARLAVDLSRLRSGLEQLLRNVTAVAVDQMSLGNHVRKAEQDIKSLRHDVDSAVSPGFVDDVARQGKITAEGLERLEQELAGTDKAVDTHNQRIERLEKDLRDTHELAERAATHHVGDKPPQQWDAGSAEPAHGGHYLDTEDLVWSW